MTGRREDAPLEFARLFAKVPRQHLPRVIFRTFHWLFQIQLAVGSASSPMLTVRDLNPWGSMGDETAKKNRQIMAGV